MFCITQPLWGLLHLIFGASSFHFTWQNLLLPMVCVEASPPGGVASGCMHSLPLAYWPSFSCLRCNNDRTGNHFYYCHMNRAHAAFPCSSALTQCALTVFLWFTSGSVLSSSWPPHTPHPQYVPKAPCFPLVIPGLQMRAMRAPIRPAGEQKSLLHLLLRPLPWRRQWR